VHSIKKSEKWNLTLIYFLGPYFTVLFTSGQYKYIQHKTNKPHLLVSWYEKIKNWRHGPHNYYTVWECTHNISRAWATYHAFRSMTTTWGVIPVPTAGHELWETETQDTYIKMWLGSSKPVSREISGTLMHCIKATILNFRLCPFKAGNKLRHCFTTTVENIIYFCIPRCCIIKNRTEVIIITHACPRL
jgi:hypothetical protein